MNTPIKSTKGRPACRWCARRLRPNYDRTCPTCNHPAGNHREQHSSRAGCSGEHYTAQAHCDCDRVYNFSEMEKSEMLKRFPRVLRGFGIDGAGLFCTKDCAVRWAHKHAELQR